MRSTLLFVLGFVLGACSYPAPSAPTGQTAFNVEELKSKSVALVRHAGTDAAAPFCSGVWVSRTSFLTASHCVKTNVENYASPGGEGVLNLAQVVVQDEEHDLALFSSLSEPPPHGIAELAPRAPTAGAKVATMGNPLGLWWSFSSGEVAAIRHLDETILLIQATAPISPGNSGCGLFDGQGRLVGIGYAVVSEGANLGFFVHLSHIQDLLSSL